MTPYFSKLRNTIRFVRARIKRRLASASHFTGHNALSEATLNGDRLIPLQLPHTDRYIVHLLCGHNAALESAIALRSFFKATNYTAPVIVHDDGTLSRREIRMLSSQGPNIRVLQRSEADKFMLARINQSKYPRCHSFRRRSVFSLKLFDLLENSAGRRIVYLDSDVLFMNKPATLLQALESHKPLPGYYLRDITYSHSWSPEGIESILGFRLNCDVPLNSGLLALDAEKPDYDLFERLLSLEGENGYAEQTLWWAFLERRGALPLPDEYDVCFRHAWRNLDRSKAKKDKATGDAVILQHYCGNAVTKSLFYDVALANPELWN